MSKKLTFFLFWISETSLNLTSLSLIKQQSAYTMYIGYHNAIIKLNGIFNLFGVNNHK